MESRDHNPQQKPAGNSLAWPTKRAKFLGRLNGVLLLVAVFNAGFVAGGGARDGLIFQVTVAALVVQVALLVCLAAEARRYISGA